MIRRGCQKLRHDEFDGQIDTADCGNPEDDDGKPEHGFFREQHFRFQTEHTLTFATIWQIGRERDFTLTWFAMRPLGTRASSAKFCASCCIKEKCSGGRGSSSELGRQSLRGFTSSGTRLTAAGSAGLICHLD